MRQSFENKGRFRRYLEATATFLDKWWVNGLIAPSLTVLPTTVAMYFIKDAGDPNATPTVPNVIWNFAHTHPYWSIVIVTAYAIVVAASIQWLKKFIAEKDIAVVELLRLFEVLEEVVGKKASRFGECAKNLCNGKKLLTPSEVFAEITKPDIQIALLAQAVYLFFDGIDKKSVSFRVSVLEIKAGVPSEWYTYYPVYSPPQTTIAKLKQKRSTVSHCLRTRDVFVVEDLQIEADKVDGHFVSGSAQQEEEGSLVCYPVVNAFANDIPYVITVVADEKNYFLKRKKDLYKWFFKRFAIRIMLERNLLTIREKCATHNAEDTNK